MIRPPTGAEHDRGPLRVAGLFAGIGGFELGLQRAGHEPALLCEIEAQAREVLSSRFEIPHDEIAKDVAEFRELPREVGLLTAGFPCQDLSSTGEKLGMEGEQSSLVGHVFRLLRNRPVEWLVIENVPFMLALRRGEAIKYICAELTELGYRWAYRVVDTQSFGLPQRRRRVFLVASLSGDPRNVLLADEAAEAQSLPDTPDWDLDVPIGFYWTEGKRSTGLANDSVPPVKPGSTIGIPSPPAILLPEGLVGKPHIRDAERLQGFPAGWTSAAENVGRASFRWKLVGNAVTVDVAEWIGRRIREPGVYDGSDDSLLGEGERCPDAAWSMDGEIHVAEVSHYPVGPAAGGLGSFLTEPVKPLSVKATRGFLSRAESGGLRFPRGFLEALGQHAKAQGG